MALRERENGPEEDDAGGSAEGSVESENLVVVKPSSSQAVNKANRKNVSATPAPAPAPAPAPRPVKATTPAPAPIVHVIRRTRAS